jgi:Ca2+-transporting ATPase
MPAELKEIFGVGLAVNTKGKVTTHDQGVLVYDGKSTECALCLYVESMGYKYEELRQTHPTKDLFDFDSDRKRMTTIIPGLTNPDEFLVCSKGAPDVMVNFCTRYIGADHEVHAIDQAFSDQLNAQLATYASKMLRSLLIAYRLGGDISSPETAEQELIIIGIAAISDPIRPEVPDAIKACRHAGVIVRMVTGDNIDTARAIATECGILSDDGVCMTGNTFRSLPKLDLLQQLPKLQVLARSTPMDKFRLVRLLKEVGEVVAVTGDGTNDAIALKTANVGLSMGLCGTDIAKEASDICILDDNFKSIMMAMMWGRCVFDNVRRFLQFQLTVNVAAVLIAFLGSCIFQESPLRPIQLLWVNLIMDSLGALALATEKPRPYLLDRPPYGRRVQLLSGVLLVNILGQAIYQVIVLVVVLVAGQYIWNDVVVEIPGGDDDKEVLYTLIFNMFVFCQIFNLPNSRIVAKSQRFFDGILSNYLFIIIFIAVAAVQAIIVEFGDFVFHTTHLTWVHWLSTLLIGAVCWGLGAILRIIPVKEISHEDVEFERAEMYEAIMEPLRGMSAEEQWARENEEAAAAAEENMKKDKGGAAKAKPAESPKAEEVPVESPTPPPAEPVADEPAHSGRGSARGSARVANADDPPANDQ